MKMSAPFEGLWVGDRCLCEHDAATTSVEDDEVLHEDGLSLRLVRQGLPRANDAALKVFCYGHAVRVVVNIQIVRMSGEVEAHRGCSVKVTVA